MREFEIFAFTEQYKGLSLTYDRDGRSITVSFITSTRQQYNRHIVTGEIASEIEGGKKKVIGRLHRRARHYGSDYASSAISFTETIADLISRGGRRPEIFSGFLRG